MAEFEPAIAVVLEHEGGFVDDPRDAGGATNFGVSLRWLAAQGRLGDYDDDGDVDVDDIRIMTREQAIRVYRQHWWDKYRYGEIRDQGVATKLFDLAVNMGARQCTLLVQQACQTLEQYVTIDGLIGPQTRRAINRLSPVWLLGELRVRVADFYRLLVHQDKRRRAFLSGWLNRAYA